MIRLITFCLITGIFFFCESNYSKGYEFPRVDSIKYVKEFIPQQELLRPLQIVVKDSLVIIVSRGDRHFFHVFTKDGVPLNSFAQKGQGPGELLDPIDYQVNDTTLTVYDLTLGKLYAYPISGIVNEPEPVGYPIGPVSIPATRVVPFSETDYCITGVLEKGIIEAYRGQTLISYIDYPIEFERYNKDLKHLALQGSLKAHHSTRKAVFASYRCDYMIFFSCDQDMKIHEIKSQYIELTRFRNDSNGDRNSISIDRDNKDGFNDLAVNHEAVFALYSGRTMAQPYTELCKEIQVFDWEGNPLRRLLLDHEALAIYVDEASNELYTIALVEEDNGELEPHYLVYDLSDIFQKEEE